MSEARVRRIHNGTAYPTYLIPVPKAYYLFPTSPDGMRPAVNFLLEPFYDQLRLCVCHTTQLQQTSHITAPVHSLIFPQAIH